MPVNSSEIQRQEELSFYKSKAYWVDQGICSSVPFLSNEVNINCRGFRDILCLNAGGRVSSLSFWSNERLIQDVTAHTGET